MSDEGKTIPISHGRKSKKTSDEQKEPMMFLIDDVCNLLARDLECSKLLLGIWPYKLITVRENLSDEPQIFKIDANNVAHKHSVNSLAGELFNYLTVVCGGQQDLPYKFRMRECLEIVKTWQYMSKSSAPLPKSIGFKSDPETVFFRLWFDPIDGVSDISESCPTWNEILGRIQNREGFCARVGSIFDPEADRKQAIWISGPKDSGKSQVAEQLRVMAGGEAVGMGAFTTMGDSDLKDKFFKAELVGKRVCVMNEVSPSFINSEEFKSITGDKFHRVRPCGMQGYNVKLEPLLFFVSNSQPETQSKPELVERIIYCRINPLPAGTELIPEKEYQRRLREELPLFVSYCMTVYSKFKGGRLPNNMEEMNDVVEGKEEEQESFFQQWFTQDENGKISANRVSEILRREGKTDRHWYGAYIKRKYGTDKRRGEGRADRRWFYYGFRERTISERSHPSLDPLPF